MTSFNHDAIVIGSGFGGAVAACRLAEAGRKVLVLERGRRWTPATYPRDDGDAWLWDQQRPERFSGWADIRVFSDMSVVAGAGVGGGSLIYANVSVEAQPEAFRRGWPPAIGYDMLKPYYDRVGHMLDVQKLPDNQLSARTVLLREAAEACGWGERFRKLPLAVSFDPAYDSTRPDPRGDHHSVRFYNRHGVAQGTCVHCGNCDIGCQVSAKNTLDLNYLAVAEKNGAEIWPLHVVDKLEPLMGTGWRVHFRKINTDSQRSEPGSCTARQVFLGAGSIGTTELLLRCRDEHRTLPDLSARLGHGWAFNGDFVTPAFYTNRKISPSHGVTISAAIDLLDYAADGQALFIEDGGIPNLAGNFIRRRLLRIPSGRLRRLWKDFGRAVDDGDPLENMMPWFGQAMEPGDGRLFLGRSRWAPWRRALRMHWPYQRSEAVVEAMVAAHRKLSLATGGKPFVPPTWTKLRNIVTPHPLGGCNMGLTSADGVVDHGGRAFGYAGLYVVDGAVIPRALGLNPSRTIAALAERNVERVLQGLS